MRRACDRRHETVIVRGPLRRWQLQLIRAGTQFVAAIAIGWLVSRSPAVMAHTQGKMALIGGRGLEFAAMLGAYAAANLWLGRIGRC